MPDRQCYRTCVEATEPEIAVPQSAVRIARIGDRMLAGILDFIVLFPLFVFSMNCIAVWNGVYRKEGYEMVGGPALLGMVIGIAIWITYHVVAEAFSGGTIGMHVASIEVRSADWTSIRFSQAVTRNLLRPIDAICFYAVGFVIATLSQRNQTIGDRAAKTVVYEKVEARRRRAILLWLAVAAGGPILLYLVFSLAIPAKH